MKIGIYPGSFKPPHRAHFEVAKLGSSECDRLYIIIGPKYREYGTIIVDQEKSKLIWDIYLDHMINHNVKIFTPDYSPIQHAYEITDKLNSSENARSYDVILYVGEKDKKEDRYRGIGQYSSNLHSIKIEIIKDIEGISSTKLRTYAMNNDKNMFFDLLPYELEVSDKDRIFSMIKQDVSNKQDLIKEEQIAGGNNKFVKHISHIYENMNLKFSDLKQFMEDIVSGKIDHPREKIDGQNIMFSWKDDTGLRFARNITDIKNGGIDRSGIKTRFDKQFISKEYEIAYDILNSYLNSNKDKFLKLFGNYENWANADVVFLENYNVIKYDHNAIVVHGFKIANIYQDIVENLDNLKKIFSPSKIEDQFNNSWIVTHDIDIEKVSLSNENALKLSIDALNKFMKINNLTDENTLYDYIRKYYINLFISNGLQFNQDVLEKFIFRLIMNDTKKIKINDVYLSCNGKECGSLISIIDETAHERNKNRMIQIEKIIVNFGSSILSDINSFLILNGSEEKNRIKNDLLNKINDLKKKPINKMIKNNLTLLNKSKISSIEGIVFYWRGSQFKITGSFAPINQLMGIGRYR